MFKKIVSQLSFSPALVGQLGFYAKRLRKEQATRRLGLIFTALALVVQSLVVFQAPEPANASNNNDMVIGGLGSGSNASIQRLLTPYDKNERHLKDIYNYFGITREEITSTKLSKLKVEDKKSYGFENRAGSKTIDITDSNYKSVATLYGRPMTIWGWDSGDWVEAYVGYSQKAGWFAIMTICGNIVTKEYPEEPERPKPANIVSSKTGVNLTQGSVAANKTTAKEGDRIKYTVTVKNTGGTATTVKMRDDLSDVMKYAKLTNNGDGTFYSGSKVLSWGDVEVKPGATITKSYVVTMKDSLLSNTTKCSMKNNFLDHSITIDVGCSTPPAEIVPSKSAVNVTQKNVNATKTSARANDVITFTVSVKNAGGTAKSVTLKDDIEEVLKFSSLTNAGGGTLNKTTGMLSWGAVDVKPGATITKKYTVKMNSSLVNETTKCKMTNTFLGESVTIPVTCTTPPADIEVSKTATNASHGNVDATTITAKENDRITFTLTATNNGGTAKAFTFTDSLSDVLEYANVINNGGGTFDEKTQKLSWPAVTLKAGQKEVRTFTVQVKSTIPATPQGTSDKSSYDCRIENTFFDAYVVIDITCPTPKVIEQVVPELPQTGPGANALFASILFAVVTYFYLRSRQLTTEVRLIRRDVNGGAI